MFDPSQAFATGLMDAGVENGELLVIPADWVTARFTARRSKATAQGCVRIRVEVIESS